MKLRSVVIPRFATGSCLLPVLHVQLGLQVIFVEFEKPFPPEVLTNISLASLWAALYIAVLSVFSFTEVRLIKTASGCSLIKG
jgi:hypothetical protein